MSYDLRMLKNSIELLEQLDANLTILSSKQNSASKVRTDAEAAACWLAKYADSSNTLAAYRKEAERFLLWLNSNGLSLKTFTIEHVYSYTDFLKDPQPRAKWCLEIEPKKLANGDLNPRYKPAKKIGRYLKNGNPNLEWKPFVSELGEVARKHTLTILYGLGEFLASILYLPINPFRAARTRISGANSEVKRYIERDVLDNLISGLEALPDENHNDFVLKERALFTVKFLYLTGLRRNEFANLNWNDIYKQRGHYWIRVVGKGRREGDVPLNKAGLEVLNRYRKSIHRGVFDGDDEGPVLRNLAGTQGVSGKTVHTVVKAALQASSDPSLAKASAHWLRHSAASHMLDAGIPLAIVRDNLRHANISTTSRYIHTGKDQRHSETEAHAI
jgi:site-specific recombinase XerD